MFALRVVGFIRRHWVHFCGSFGSSGITGFTPIRPWGRWLLPGSFSLLEFALVVVGFIRGRLEHWGLPWVLLRTTGVVGFTWVRTGGRCAHKGMLGSLRFALRFDAFIQGGWVLSDSLRGSFGSIW